MLFDFFFQVFEQGRFFCQLKQLETFLDKVVVSLANAQANLSKAKLVVSFCLLGERVRSSR